MVQNSHSRFLWFFVLHSLPSGGQKQKIEEGGEEVLAAVWSSMVSNVMLMLCNSELNLWQHTLWVKLQKVATALKSYRINENKKDTRKLMLQMTKCVTRTGTEVSDVHQYRFNTLSNNV